MAVALLQLDGEDLNGVLVVCAELGQFSSVCGSALEWLEQQGKLTGLSLKRLKRDVLPPLER